MIRVWGAADLAEFLQELFGVPFGAFELLELGVVETASS